MSNKSIKQIKKELRALSLKATTRADQRAAMRARIDFFENLAEARRNPGVRVILDPTYIGRVDEARVMGQRTWVFDESITEGGISRAIQAASESGRRVHITIVDTNYQLAEGTTAPGFIAELSRDFTNDQEQPRDRDHSTLCWGNLFGPEGIIVDAAQAGHVTFGLVKGLRYRGIGYGSEIDAALRWTAGMEMGDDTLHIVSMSFGGSGAGAYDAIFGPEVQQDRPVVFLASMGNSGGGEDIDKGGYPAKGKYCMGSGATSKGPRRASFSSTSPELDVMSPGQSTPSRDWSGDPVNWSGTSSSCPHLAGLAALCYLEDGTLRNHETMSAFLKLFAQDMAQEGHDWLTGYGYAFLPDYLEQEPEDEPGEPEPPNPEPEPDPILWKLNLEVNSPLVSQYKLSQEEDTWRWMRFGRLRVLTDFEAKDIHEAERTAHHIMNRYFGHFRGMVGLAGWTERDTAKWLLQFFYFVSRNEGFTMWPLEADWYASNSNQAYTLLNSDLDERRGRLGTSAQEHDLPEGVATIDLN